MQLKDYITPSKLIPALICLILTAGGIFFLHPEAKTGSGTTLYQKNSTGYQKLITLPAGTAVQLTRKSGDWFKVKCVTPPLSGWINGKSVNLTGGLLHRLIFMSHSGGFTGKERPFLTINIKQNSKTSYSYLSVLAPFAILIGLLTMLLSRIPTIKNSGSVLLGGFLLIYLLFSGGLQRQQFNSKEPPYDPALVKQINTKSTPTVYCRTAAAADFTRALLGKNINVHVQYRMKRTDRGYAVWNTSPGQGWIYVGGSGRVKLYFRE